jgi:alpha-N-arabinofuranosidase
MTGMERNSDIIVMASYAPLLVNVNPGGMQWESDLIGYTADKSYGSPSYYAQVLFDQYLGTEILSGQLSGANPRCFYSATYSPDKSTLYLKLVNASSASQPIAIQLQGAGSVEKTAKLISLSATNTEETNTIDHPERIVPVEHELKDVSGSFSHTLPPYSIEVLALRAK